jgi:putative transcriptional regulator
MVMNAVSAVMAAQAARAPLDDAPGQPQALRARGRWHRANLAAMSALMRPRATLLTQGVLSIFACMGSRQDNAGHLTGMLLVAMPSMSDPRFAHSVIYLCAHSEEGAMGLVVNQTVDNVTLPHVIGQLGIESSIGENEVPVHFGGPVETSRGFVLHSPDYVHESTLVIDEGFALTATVDVLRAIAQGEGPKRRVFALGYAGWGAGQLDAEIQANGWMIVPADAEIVFSNDNETKWQRALAKLGIDPSLLSSAAGHA